MKNILKFLIWIIVVFLSHNLVNASSWDIDFIVSPIKYEINADPWDSITKTAKIINLSPSDANLTSFSANFYSNWTTWAPSFAKDWSVPNPNRELASWISISENSFSVEKWKNRTIDFTINIPSDATPGWHYWAVFFKYNWWWEDWKVSIQADYWVLILVNVSWEIIDNSNQWQVSVWWGIWEIEYPEDDKNVSIIGSTEKDDCKIDLTKSDTDGKCVDEEEVKDYIDEIKNQITWESDNWEDNENDNQNNEKSETNNEEIIFNIPFENKWNTHIKPKWEITLKDENWNKIKAISKEEIKNQNWDVVWEKIIDYININPWDWNVLPDSERIFKSDWKWILKLDRDKNWETIIKTQNIDDYFSDLYSTKRNKLYPWERFCEKLETKKITADIKTSYKNYEWKEVEFNSAKELDIKYKKRYVWINPYFFILLWLLFIFLWLLWIIIFGRRKKKCKNCKKKIKKDMKICPYCGKKQKKKEK